MAKVIVLWVGIGLLLIGVVFLVLGVGGTVGVEIDILGLKIKTDSAGFGIMFFGCVLALAGVGVPFGGGGASGGTAQKPRQPTATLGDVSGTLRRGAGLPLGTASAQGWFWTILGLISAAGFFLTLFF